MLTKDHTGLPFSLSQPPTRIVSLVPSITELLYDLGLGQQVVGRTKFCIYPEGSFDNSIIIGGTKKVHIEKVKALHPDLVIANKEENIKEQVLAISAFANTFTTVVRDTPEALKMILDLGVITGKGQKAQEIVHEFNSETSIHSPNQNLSMVYLIWQKPYMTVGGDTFISAFMEDFGFINCFKDQKRYPEISLADIVKKKPDLILLSSEPFPFNKKNLLEISKETGIKTNLIDGSICSWYGSRMLMAKDFFKTFKQQIHQELSLNSE